MGWKSVKEHYRIEHIVTVADGVINIGSPYIHNLIVIGLDGLIKKRYMDRSNTDLVRYQNEMDTDPAKLHELVLQEDTFGELIKVYTYDDADIIEKHCEELGYPNVTIDGDLMYENTYSDDKNKIIAIAKRNMEAAVKWAQEHVKNSEESLQKAKTRLHENQCALEKLEADYPGIKE